MKIELINCGISIVNVELAKKVNEIMAHYLAKVGTITDTDKRAVRNMVSAIVSNELWDKVKLCYPMIGSTEMQIKANLVADDLDARFPSSTEYRENGVYLNTGGTITKESVYWSTAADGIPTIFVRANRDNGAPIVQAGSNFGLLYPTNSTVGVRLKSTDSFPVSDLVTMHSFAVTRDSSKTYLYVDGNKNETTTTESTNDVDWYGNIGTNDSPTSTSILKGSIRYVVLCRQLTTTETEKMNAILAEFVAATNK